MSQIHSGAGLGFGTLAACDHTENVPEHVQREGLTTSCPDLVSQAHNLVPRVSSVSDAPRGRASTSREKGDTELFSDTEPFSLDVPPRGHLLCAGRTLWTIRTTVVQLSFVWRNSSTIVRRTIDELSLNHRSSGKSLDKSVSPRRPGNHRD
jgi:hypothetical protein